MTRIDIDAEVQRLLAENQAGAAAALASQAYADELLGYLAKRGLDRDEAQDVLGQVREDLVKGIATFRGDSSFASWLYVVVRNALARTHRAGRLPTQPLDDDHDIEAPRGRPRTTHQLWFIRLRPQLDPVDLQLLELREVLELDWEEVAARMPARNAAAWRQHYRRLLEDLRELARRAGVL